MNDVISKAEQENLEQEKSTHDKADSEESPAQKKHWKLYLSLTFFFISGGWLFWNYAPTTAQLANHFMDTLGIAADNKPSNSLPPANNLENSSPAYHNKTASTFSTAQPITALATTAASPSVDTPTFETTPIKIEPAPADLSSIDSDALLLNLQQLQQQISVLRQDVQSIQQQQRTQLQMHVQSQLFSTLLQASSKESSLSKQIIAWKSISFMPLLHADKHALAERAYNALQGLNRATQAAEQEIDDWITTLSSQLSETDAIPVITTTAASIDPYQQSNNPLLNWLQREFIISRVAPRALAKLDGPDAPTQRLIQQLQQLQQLIHLAQWDNIGDLDTIFYQLGQHGLTPNLSPETITAFKPIQQTWQTNAQTWMEQL